MKIATDSDCSFLLGRALAPLRRPCPLLPALQLLASGRLLCWSTFRPGRVLYPLLLVLVALLRPSCALEEPLL